jgi:hypothetical protein
VRIYQRPAFLRALNKLPAATQTLVRAQARHAAESIGKPHLHSGVGIRPFGPYLEFRVRLDLRCLFLLEGGDLHLVVVGSHKEIATYVRNNR